MKAKKIISGQSKYPEAVRLIKAVNSEISKQNTLKAAVVETATALIHKAVKGAEIYFDDLETDIFEFVSTNFYDEIVEYDPCEEAYTLFEFEDAGQTRYRIDFSIFYYDPKEEVLGFQLILARMGEREDGDFYEEYYVKELSGKGAGIRNAFYGKIFQIMAAARDLEGYEDGEWEAFCPDSGNMSGHIYEMTSRDDVCGEFANAYVDSTGNCDDDELFDKAVEDNKKLLELAQFISPVASVDVSDAADKYVIIPADPMVFGSAIGWEDGMFVLYQYIPGCWGDYMTEAWKSCMFPVYRTADIKEAAEIAGNVFDKANPDFNVCVLPFSGTSVVSIYNVDSVDDLTGGIERSMSRLEEDAKGLAAETVRKIREAFS